MNLKHHTHPDRLEKYSFIWSEIRFIIAAVALFLGGIPPLLAWFGAPGTMRMLSNVLMLCWIISGIASAYLLYTWWKKGQMVFGSKSPKDRVAFLVMAVTGINLGLAGVLGKNIGMSLFGTRVLLMIGAIIYVVTAVYLYQRWNANGKRLF